MPEAAVAPHLTLSIQRTEDGAIVRCSGRLVSGVNSTLYTKVSQLIPGSKRIVLDLTELTHMDSMGLGTLVRLYISAKSSGCSLELVNIGKQIQQLLSLTNMLSVFTVIGEQGGIIRF